MGMYMVKYGCELFSPGTPKSALSQEQIDELPYVVIIVPMKSRIKTKIIFGIKRSKKKNEHYKWKSC